MLEQGGSLTIISTALIDTGSEWTKLLRVKGTGNSELILDRKVGIKEFIQFPDANFQIEAQEEKNFIC